MKCLLVLYIVILVLDLVLSANTRVDPLVLIDQGLVRGERSSDGLYSSFLGIPYAQVDSENPFGVALPPTSFNGNVFIANNADIHCPQGTDENGTLDCLRLNIYVPSKAITQNPLPVLVYIHGGAYQEGKAGLYSAPNILAQDVILVTINYRLNAYGFMCLHTPTVPGNQGLKDQFAALQWVRKNINAFGGNPYKVTIAGQSAGSSSAAYHLYSSQQKLFNKVILQSGVPQTLGLFVKADEEAAIKLAVYLGFNTTDTERALGFLKNTSPNLVVGATIALGLNFMPCEEHLFSGVLNIIESDPFTVTNPSKIKNTPILIGSTSNEAYSVFLQEFDTDHFYEYIKSYFDLSEEEIEKAATVVKHYYIGDKEINEESRFEIETFVSDYIFLHPNQRTVTRLLQENASPVFEYVFNYHSENDDGEEGNVPHNSELKYIFASNYDSFTNEEKLTSDRMTLLWTNFIKSGNPTPSTSDLVPVKWEPVAKDNRPFMMIGKDLELDHRYRKESMAFWDLFYKGYGQYNNLVRRNCNI